MSPTSFEIGRAHEARLRDLFDAWNLIYVRKKKVRTEQGRILELDCWLPALYSLLTAELDPDFKIGTVD